MRRTQRKVCSEKTLISIVADFRSRPLDQGPYTCVWLDALVHKVREGGRTISVSAVIAIGVNSDAHREVLGTDVITAEDGAGWVAFLRGLKARGQAGVQLVISDDHTGLVEAIASVPGCLVAAVPNPFRPPRLDARPQGRAERSEDAPMSSASFLTAALWFASSVLLVAEQNDEWLVARRYMGVEPLTRARMHMIEGENKQVEVQVTQELEAAI